uniref:Ribosome maturation protein SDO1/SBDS central domain-containing protein n=1 Tax=Eptatretus burgeri TaxID=7764 RepID=A0A8C4QFD1_EPTBU
MKPVGCCWKNKCILEEWRARVRGRMSRGDSKHKDTMMAFGTKDTTEICRKLLGKSRVCKCQRVSRQHFINPTSERLYPPGEVELAVMDIHFTVKPGWSRKQQALEVIRRIKETVPIEIALMHLRVQVGGANAKWLCQCIMPLIKVVDSKKWDEDLLEIECLADDPDSFRELSEMLGLSEHPRCQGKSKREMKVWNSYPLIPHFIAFSFLSN